MMTINKNIAIIIPAFKPNQRLLTLIHDLHIAHFENIILVNDGSPEECNKIFAQVRGVNMLTHKVNSGKGRAMKTGFDYYMKNFSSKLCGVITIDADGQHLAKDAVSIANKISEIDSGIVMGCRNFYEEQVPFRSRLGNVMIRKLMNGLFGVETSDTQTGLRGFTNDVINKVATFSGERFEYETNMLIEARKQNIKTYDVPITTVYGLEDNQSNYHPIKDSRKILSLIIRKKLCNFK